MTVNAVVIIVITACIEIFRGILKIRRVAIALVVIRYDLICSIFLNDAIKSTFITLALCAIDILNMLIWEFTGMISYQAFIAMDAAIMRIGYVYVSSKAVYFYTSSHTNQTSIILNPIMLALIS